MSSAHRISSFDEVLADTQGCERAAAQGDERQESNDQSIAVLKSVRFIRALCDIRIGNGTIHEFDPEQIEPIAGYQMIFSGTPWCCDSDALDDGHQPGPISIGADKLQRVTKVTKIGSERRHFARSSAPVNIFGHNAPIDPCFRRSRKAIRVDSRDEAQESPIAFPPRLTGCWCKVRATAAFIKPVGYLERRLPTTLILGWPVCK